MTSFEDIYNQHKSLVYNLALHYLQNVQDAQEVTQDVFLSVFEKLPAFRNEASTKTWIYRIVINKSLDFIKAKQRKKRWSLFKRKPMDDAFGASQLSEFNHPGVQLEQKEALKGIFCAINKLPDNQKNAIVLLKIQQLSQKETAEILGLSLKALESLFHRAKKNLEIKLDQAKD